jgi:hypothetical protein
MKKKNKYPIALERANNFRRLVAEIRKIDRQAADYLVVESKRAGSHIHYKLSGGGMCRALSGLMIWDATPQEHDYWSNIAEQIQHGW